MADEVQQASPEVEVPTHIMVSVEDLDAIRAALNSAFYHQSTYDMIESYRQLGNSTQSPLTRALGSALGVAQGYLTQYLTPPSEEASDGEV